MLHKNLNLYASSYLIVHINITRWNIQNIYIEIQPKYIYIFINKFADYSMAGIVLRGTKESNKPN